MVEVEWSEFWRIGRTGFHREDVHELLVEHGSWLLENGPRVGVPLCGKSQDLIWLGSRAPAVVGMELVEQPIQEFMTEHGFVSSREDLGSHVRWTTPGPTILQGDVFEVDREKTGPLQAIWDRAALVAIPQPRRARYVARVVDLLDPGSRILLVCWDADRPVDVGPPFRIRSKEVYALYSPHGEVEQVASFIHTAETDERVRAKGLDWVREEVYRITLR
jgi:thiopurine S-methyltransferase